MANNIVHFEISVDDMERAIKFYSEVLGWAFQPLGEKYDDYTIVYPGGEITPGNPPVGINGGMMKRKGPAPSREFREANSFVCVVATDDVDLVVQKTEEHGGRIEMQPEDVDGVGRLAYIWDTEGNMLGIIKPVEGGAGM